MCDVLFATCYRVETEIVVEQHLLLELHRGVPQLFNCDSTKNRGRLTARMIRISVLDYIARNHKQRIHRPIDDSGSNNVMRVFRSS